jgi:AcrR family transcriptional regulator
MVQPLGLRERKKLRTRLLIAETARRLFAERGFDAVSVAEIARVADVSEATVFNYFPTKEDLVYQGMQAFEDELLSTIRDRPASESVIDAFGRFVLRPRGFLATEDKGAADALLAVSQMIAASPALLAREEQILARYRDSLAALLATETGAAPNDLRPQAVAAALIGLHGALIAYVRRRICQMLDIARLAEDLRSEGERALTLLRNGLADYGASPRPTIAPPDRSPRGVDGRAGRSRRPRN